MQNYDTSQAGLRYLSVLKLVQVLGPSQLEKGLTQMGLLFQFVRTYEFAYFFFQVSILLIDMLYVLVILLHVLGLKPIGKGTVIFLTNDL